MTPGHCVARYHPRPSQRITMRSVACERKYKIASWTMRGRKRKRSACIKLKNQRQVVQCQLPCKCNPEYDWWHNIVGNKTDAIHVRRKPKFDENKVIKGYAALFHVKLMPSQDTVSQENNLKEVEENDNDNQLPSKEEWRGPDEYDDYSVKDYHPVDVLFLRWERRVEHYWFVMLNLFQHIISCLSISLYLK